MFNKFGLRSVLLAGTALGIVLSGCTALPQPEFDTTTRPKLPSSIPRQNVNETPSESSPVVTITLPAGTLQAAPLSRRVELSSVMHSQRVVRHVMSGDSGATVEYALRAVLDGTGVGLVVTDRSAASKAVTMDIEGTPEIIVNRVCRAAGVYCAYSDGAIEVRSTEVFSVGLPPVPEMQKGVQEAIGRILSASADPGAAGSTTPTTPAASAGSVVVDPVGNRITYTATLDQERRVEDYLGRIKDAALIIYDCWISEVQLTQQTNRGVQFNKLSGAMGAVNVNVSGGSSVSGDNAIGFGSIFNGTQLTVDVLAKFLAEQGSINTLASPTVGLISGTKAEFKDTESQSYVSRIGVLTNGSAPTGSAAAAAAGGYQGASVLNNTVETKDLETGTVLKLGGLWQDGTVNTDLDISISALLQFGTVQASGTTLQLPHTVKRSLTTRTVLRPGDVLLIAGIRANQGSATRDGLPLFGGDATIPTKDSTSGLNREFVITIRPRVVVYHVDDRATRVGGE